MEPIENNRLKTKGVSMTSRERGLMMKLAEELGKTKERINVLEQILFRELETLKENQYELHGELKEVYRIVIE